MATRLVILCAERSRREPLAALCQEYLARLERYNLRATIEECSASNASTPEATVAVHSAQILARLHARDTVVLLDERGQVLRSEEFARLLERWMMHAARRLVFVIGGPWGVAPAVRERADATISLSALTLPHELARLVLCEQLYRAVSILRGEPYHHGER
ncbi:MAG: 23S rRNA (pseudouridine(1915)-N(3))-methyltransferase RlmH [Chlorobiota bacterium]|nr:MAG: 23S rRNA (pseudouridine(1915)-N(3))-methyltransferase RlmH [Chlorobiota bacterium]